MNSKLTVNQPDYNKTLNIVIEILDQNIRIFEKSGEVNIPQFAKYELYINLVRIEHFLVYFLYNTKEDKEILGEQLKKVYHYRIKYY